MSIRKGLSFLGICFLLAVVAEVSLFQHEVGVSYSLFIFAFYLLFFLRFRRQRFSHKQIGLLIAIVIAILTLSYAVFSNPMLYTLNFFLIPMLIFVHTTLITSPAFIRWYSTSFLQLSTAKIGQMVRCAKLSISYTSRKVKGTMNEQAYKTGKKIAIGLVFSIPLLFVVIFLLTTADRQFAQILSQIPEKLFNVNGDMLWTIIKILFFTLVFFCYFKVVAKKTNTIVQAKREVNATWDVVIVITILVSINIVYLLFSIVQFQYFFSGTLEDGLSYSEYARRGFFELIIVTILNYFILTSSLAFVKIRSRVQDILLTMLIIFSGIMLVSAFLRLMLYEQAYGFTYLRVFAHSFMIYLSVVLAFSLIKVWARRLSLTRFFILSSLLFYLSINIFGMDYFIVTKNIERYEQTGKIDMEYLGSLSYSAVPALVKLYEKDPEIPRLKATLLHKRDQLLQQEDHWQSYNFSRELAKASLNSIER